MIFGCDPDGDYSHLKEKLPLTYVSSAILVDEDDKILIAQRPKDKKFSGFWEFPGGKLENGEIPEIALVRELQEELNIKTSPTCLLPLNFVSHRYDDFHLIMYVFICRRWSSVIKPMENQTLKWITPKDLVKYDMPKANLPLLASIRDLL